MSLFFALALSLFFLVVVLQNIFIRCVLPQSISAEDIAGVVSMANALNPDLIVLTGDYVNNNACF
ncbi:MAG: hypothetical protein JW883_05145 [Deltaproteobacteria bacterium]|nr:hypothetical protein [Deltaproteobacteria bacterium]